MPKFRVKVWNPNINGGPYEVEVSADTSGDAETIVSRRERVDLNNVYASFADSNAGISGKTWLFIIAICLLISYPVWILVFLGIVGVICLFKKNFEDGYF